MDTALGKPRTPQSWNRYNYALGNPMRYVDPNGLDPDSFSDYMSALGTALAETADQVGYQVAYPALKVMSGLMNDDPVEVAGGYALILSEAAGGVAADQAVRAFRVGWTSRANLLDHYGRHGAQMGFKTAEGYGMAASKFAARAGTEGVETVTAETGEKYVYDQATKEFAVVNKEGDVVTYYKAKLRSWLNILKKHAPRQQ